MTRQRDPGAYIEMLSFIMLGHPWATSLRRAGFAGAAALPISGCAGELSALNPAGPGAAHVYQLWWIMLAGAAVILIGTLGVALYALKPERRGRKLSERKMLIGWGLVFPTVTLAALLVFALASGEQLLARQDPSVRTFEVEARQWSWRFVYPEGGATDDVLHVPAGARFHLIVTSRDVIHSLWVPRLGGKIDAIPGKRNRIALSADRPGVYRGICSEYCGVEHAHMLFEVHAHPAEDYPAVLAEATGIEADQVPVLRPRRAPIADTLEAWVNYLRKWLSLP